MKKAQFLHQLFSLMVYKETHQGWKTGKPGTIHLANASKGVIDEYLLSKKKCKLNKKVSAEKNLMQPF